MAETPTTTKKVTKGSWIVYRRGDGHPAGAPQTSGSVVVVVSIHAEQLEAALAALAIRADICFIPWNGDVQSIVTNAAAGE